MKEYDLYLFDFDNTLFDTRAGIEAIFVNGLPAIGIEYDRSQFKDYLGMSIDEIFDNFAEDPDTYDEYIRKVNEVIMSDAYRGAVPYPDAETVLRELRARGKDIGIASGKASFKIEALLEDAGLRDIPSVIVGWFETERHKPDPQPIEYAFSHFDVPKDRTVYIGDSPNDSLAATAFGVDCIIVDRHDGNGPGNIPCTFTVESLTEILDW